jgi:hypothetical protein
MEREPGPRPRPSVSPDVSIVLEGYDEVTMTSIRIAATSPPPARAACGHCGFSGYEHAGRLSRALSRTAVRYERAVWVVFADGLPGDELGRSMLDQVVHVRDALHGYANRLGRLADFDGAVFADLDTEPIQVVALDYTWAAVTGLVANIHRLAASIDDFSAGRWDHRGVLHGRSVTALELANYGVHEAIHHLVDVERLARPAADESAAISERHADSRQASV